MEKIEHKKKPIEIANLYQILSKKKLPLPNILVYVSEDSYEFELALDHYKEVLNQSGLQADTHVFVSETGDIPKLFAELFTPDMFYPTKLLVIKNASSFFKPLIDPKEKGEWKDIQMGFSNGITEISNETFLLIHYNNKDLPATFSKLFNGNYTYYKPKVLFPSDIPKVLDEIFEQEKVTFDEDARDEFVYRLTPNSGTYIKSIKKLKLTLGKSKFNKNEIEKVLFLQSSLNPNLLVDYLFQGRKGDFFREFAKFNLDNSEILIFLSRFLTRLDDIRRYKTIKVQSQGEVSMQMMDEYMGMSMFSDAKKNFLRRQLNKESNIMTIKALIGIYEIIVEMNLKYKSGLKDEEGKIYFQKKILDIFHYIYEEF